jgi:hypothetical protein
LIDLDFNITVSREGSFSMETVNALKTIFYQFSIHSEGNLLSNMQSKMIINNPEYTDILEIHSHEEGKSPFSFWVYRSNSELGFWRLCVTKSPTFQNFLLYKLENKSKNNQPIRI